MTTQVMEELSTKKCRPCEGGIEKLARSDAETMVNLLTGWRLSHDGQWIEKYYPVKDFTAGIDFFNRVALVAEAEGHHPDLHLTGYRHVVIELSTHAIGGLSENDFIMAAKIDTLPVELKEPGV